MNEKVIIAVRGGVADLVAATSNVEVVILDYDGVQIGEGLSEYRPYAPVWTSQQMEEFIDRELEENKIEEDEY